MNLPQKKEPPLPGPSKFVEERGMVRGATGSWVQCANGFGEISLRLLSGSPRTRGEREKCNGSAITSIYIGVPYKILGKKPPGEEFVLHLRASIEIV